MPNSIKVSVWTVVPFSWLSLVRPVIAATEPFSHQIKQNHHGDSPNKRLGYLTSQRWFFSPWKIKAWSEWACHHIILTSWPPANPVLHHTKDHLQSPWRPPAAERGFVCSVCMERKVSGPGRKGRVDSHASTRRPCWPWNPVSLTCTVNRTGVRWECVCGQEGAGHRINQQFVHPCL